jgi:S-methylmethionine-dependent homocysteine/selenocysteine methylase
VSFLPDETGGRLLGGDNLLEAADMCVRSGAESVLVNCSHPDVLERALTSLEPLVEDGIVIGAYANSARMHVEFGGGVKWEPDSRPEAERALEYAQRAERWVSRFGVRIIGSCCGTGPAYTKELVATLRPGG